MRYPIRRSAAFLLAACALGSAACGKKEAPKPAETPAAVQPAPPPAPLAVATIDLGKSVDSSRKVASSTTTFGVRDTIYASVGTTGVGSNATIGAKWSFVKKDSSLVAVNESSQTITTTGPVATEFHIAKATAWPKGNYRVEVTLNGASAGTKDFTVQ